MLVPIVHRLSDPGLAVGRDTVVHIGNIVESAHCLEAGLPPWNWLPDVAGGYGGPNFEYYGSLAFVFPGALVRCGVTPVTAAKALVAASLVIGSLSAFLFCRRFGGDLAGFAGAGLFLYSPYVLWLAFVRGGYPELLACALYPLVFHFVHAWIESGRLSRLGLSAAVYSAVLGVHTLSALILTPFAFLFAIAIGRASRQTLAKSFGFLAVGVAMASPFLIGPVFGRNSIVLDDQFGSTALVDALAIPWHTLLFGEPMERIVSHARAGRLHVIVCVGGSILVIMSGRGEWRRQILVFVGLALFALLLCEQTFARVAAIVVPGFTYLQFPWRLLSLFSIFVAGTLACALSSRGPIPSFWRVGVSLGILAGAVLLYGSKIPPQKVATFDTDSRESIRRSLTTLDHEDKYMPRWAVKPDHPRPEQLLVLPDGVVAELRATVNDYAFEVLSSTGGEARFQQFWWPRWRCELNGDDWPIARTDDGVVSVRIPPGKHEVRLFFARSMGVVAACLVSLGTFAVCLIGGFLQGSRPACRGPSPKEASGDASEYRIPQP